MTDSLAPLPCPFCAGDVMTIHPAPHGTQVQVTCLRCDARGSARTTRILAVTAWNGAPRDGGLDGLVQR